MPVETIEEKQALDEFRELVKDLNLNDKTLIRFLRARNHNLAAAESMLRTTMQWRIDNDVDNALNWPVPEVIVEKFPVEFPGEDYAHQAVFYLPIGGFPVRQMIEDGHLQEMLKYIIVILERLMYETEKSGELFTMLIDFEHLTFWSCAHYETMQAVMRIFRNFEMYYPERLNEVMLYNTPFVFKYGWSFIKPLLTGKTLGKVKMLGNNEKEYLPEILKRIPVTSLPTNLRKLVEKRNHNQ